MTRFRAPATNSAERQGSRTARDSAICVPSRGVVWHGG